LFRIFFWLFFVNAIALGYLGGKPAEGIYVILSRVATAWYFLHFLAILPILSMFETTKPLPKSISEPVLKGNSKSAGPLGAGLEPAE
jgi:ubiquinol-cytochrome c reductase cytochrome b subunit